MKTKFLLLTIIVSALSCFVQAQTPLWVNSYGGTDEDVSNSITTDASGNIYITGSFKSPTLPLGLTNSGGWDAFVAKFNSSGMLIWAASSNGPNANEYGNDITVDPATGDVYVIGSFEGASISFGTFTLSNSGGSDFFIVKYNAAGSVQWAVTNSGGGSENDYGNGIKYESGNLYTIGSFESNTLILSGFTATNFNPPFSDVFITKLDPASGTFTSVDVPKGDGDDYGTDIDVSSTGNMFITGYFDSPLLDFGPLSLTNSGSAGTSDIFVAEYSTVSFNCVWAENPTGNQNDYALGVLADNAGDVFITGHFDSPSLSLGSVSVTNSGTSFSDYFVAKCSPSSPDFLWVQSANANYEAWWNFDDVGKSLALDDCDHLYVTGWYNSFQINFGTGIITNATNNNYSEIFIAKYDANSGTILNLFQGHEVLDDRGTGIAVSDCECPVVTGWFNRRLNFTGTFLTHISPDNTADFYVGQVCGYNCAEPCDNLMADLSTGSGIPIGTLDANWTINLWPAGINPTGVVACPWSTGSWTYGAPFTGTQWVSVFDSTFTAPDAPVGLYKFNRTFILDSLCAYPELDICCLVDDSARIYLNGNYIGYATSMYVPANIYVSGSSGFFTPGNNTLTVEVFNTVAGEMAFDLKGQVCCSSNPCDSLWVTYNPVGNCCSDIYLTNASPDVSISLIQFSTASGNSTLNPTVPSGSSFTLSTTGPTNLFYVFPGTSTTFSDLFTLCVDPDPDNNPQQINIEWMGFTTNNDTIWCYDTLYMYCPVDSLSCDSCDNIVQTVKTGVPGTTWTLLAAPPGVTTGVPAPSVPVIPADWRAPFPGTKWISYTGSGGNWAAPSGVYHYQTSFCICDTCPKNYDLIFKYCILVDDTAEIYMNSTHIGTATTQMVPSSGSVSGSFIHAGLNTLDVYVTNDPPYYTGFDMEGWICCEKTNGIGQSELDDQVNIYPNPAGKNLYLKSSLKIYSASMYSITGVPVRNVKINGYQQRFQTYDLNSGMYFMKIITERGTVIKKIIIKH